MENAEKKSGNTGEKGRIGRYSERFREFITSGKRVKLIVALGVIGIALILLSDILPEGKKSGEPVQAEQTDFYAVADALEELERNTGCTYEKLYIVGGGEKNAFLNRLTEEATGKQVIALPIEATALGNLKIQLEVTK